MLIQKTLAVIFAPLALGAVLQARPAQACGEPLTTNSRLITDTMEKAGCGHVPPPGLPQLDRYCAEMSRIGGALTEEFSDIASLVETQGPEAAILAMRAVPEHRIHDQRRIARASALDLADAAITYVFTEQADAENPLLKKAHDVLKEMLEEFPEAEPKRQAQIHERAFNLSFELAQYNVKPQYITAAKTLAIATEDEDITDGISFPSRPAPAELVDWLSLYWATETLKETLRQIPAGEAGGNSDKLSTDILTRVMTRHLT
jgi:hypothetical protein